MKADAFAIPAHAFVIPAKAGIQGIPVPVIPAKAGIQGFQVTRLDPRLRGDGGLQDGQCQPHASGHAGHVP